MKKFLIANVLVAAGLVHSGEFEVQLPISGVQNSLQAMADAQVFTVVSPEGVPYRDQTKRFRVTTISVQPSATAGYIDWKISGLFSVRGAYPVSGNASLKGSTLISAKVTTQGVQVLSCLEGSRMSITTWDPALNAVVGGLTTLLNTAVLGKLNLCVQFAAPMETYSGKWSAYGVNSISVATNNPPGYIGVKVETGDSPALIDKNGVNSSPIMYLLN